MRARSRLIIKFNDGPLALNLQHPPLRSLQRLAKERGYCNVHVKEIMHPRLFSSLGVRDKKVTGTRRTVALNQAAAFNSEEIRVCPQKPSKSWFMTAHRMARTLPGSG